MLAKSSTATATSLGSSLVSQSTSFPYVPISFFWKKYKDVNMKWVLQIRPFIHVFQPSLASYTTEECFKSLLEFLCHLHLFGRGESKSRYDQTVVMFAQKHGIYIACVHTARSGKTLTKMMK